MHKKYRKNVSCLFFFSWIIHVWYTILCIENFHVCFIAVIGEYLSLSKKIMNSAVYSCVWWNLICNIISRQKIWKFSMFTFKFSNQRQELPFNWQQFFFNFLWDLKIFLYCVYDMENWERYFFFYYWPKIEFSFTRHFHV